MGWRAKMHARGRGYPYHRVSRALSPPCSLSCADPGAVEGGHEDSSGNAEEGDRDASAGSDERVAAACDAVSAQASELLGGSGHDGSAAEAGGGGSDGDGGEQHGTLPQLPAPEAATVLDAWYAPATRGLGGVERRGGGKGEGGGCLSHALLVADGHLPAPAGWSRRAV